MDSEKPQPLHGLIVRIACTLIGLPLLYVLSCGPLFQIYWRYPKSQPFINEFDRPLIWFYFSDPSFQLPRPLRAYFDWWSKDNGMPKITRGGIPID